ncbi:MAG: DUF4982 domain-containing protein [Lachnospiraceae bacterium]|nr:DUF4982 domain-containing protein [Lachnospiraceae bacterium]
MCRERLFNDGWEFAKTVLGTEIEDLTKEGISFEPVDLPHDWLIYNTKDLYEDGTGWYRRRYHAQEISGHVMLRFDGVYMDSTVYVNGQKAGDWKYGYSAFEFEITHLLKTGDNEILVQVRHQSPNSRWYSGAGIYRNVWLKQLPESYLVSDGVYITPRRDGSDGQENLWNVGVDVELYWQGEKKMAELCCRIYRADKEGKPCGDVVATGCVTDIWGKEKVHLDMALDNPQVWDLENPALYVMEVCLKAEDQKEDVQQVTFGCKSVEFSPEKGFLLNGRKVKLNGVCEHHDLGCLGAAYSQAAMRRKLVTLGKMGVNAIRTSHNMPAAEFMDLADQMGFLVVSEAFDMWEKSKTQYDYARFFKEWAAKDVASWVRRDRNHPSLIMWSIGNEIYDTHADEHGQEITRMLKELVESHDPLGNGAVTIGSNYMPWENAQKCADILKMAGYNYAERYYEKHHEQYPDWVIYGSETSSVVQSRGVYHFPLEQPILTDDDEQCSSLGNSTTSWGAKSAEFCIYADRDAKFSMGQFIWTGHDYIGEPTPYQTKNSYFGQIDTAGFPKDSYYIYQAEWTDYKKAPMVHLFPYWDFNEGQMIDLRACTNASSVEIFLNDKSLGVTHIDHEKGQDLVAHVKVPYEKGTIRAVAYDETGKAIAEDIHKSFGESSRITLKADRMWMRADGEDMIFVEIGMLDKDGNPVENASDYVDVWVTGAGRLLGLDNGDSTDYDQYKGTCRKLFNGKLLAVIGAGVVPGAVGITVTDIGEKEKIAPASLAVQAVAAEVREGVSANTRNQKMPLVIGSEDQITVRKIEIVSPAGQNFGEGREEIEVCAYLHPADVTVKDVEWSVVNDAGIPTNLAEIELLPLGEEEISDDTRVLAGKVRIKALGDGHFRVRCISRDGSEKVRQISELELTAEGLGQAFINPYEFVVGGLYSDSKGDVSGYNERGVGTGREGETWIGYSNVDFGDYGSDEISIPIFAMNDDPYGLQIWEGMPDEEGSRLLADVVYQMPCIWDVYQTVTYKLSRRVRGIKTICFVTKDQKFFIKGFSFKKYNKAFEQLQALECNRIYGDTYKKVTDAVEGIGNNVSLEYENMDFGENGISKITICGKTPLENNTIHIRFFGEDGQGVNQLVEFPGAAEYEEHTFELAPVLGKKKVVFVFLPGCDFDFKWFRFS